MRTRMRKAGKNCFLCSAAYRYHIVLTVLDCSVVKPLSLSLSRALRVQLLCPGP